MPGLLLAAALAASSASASCPIEIGLRFAAAADPASARATVAAAYQHLQDASHTKLRLTAARIGGDPGAPETTIFVHARVPDRQAQDAFVVIAKQAGFAITAPPPHETCDGETSGPGTPASGHVVVTGICRIAVPAEMLEFDAVFPRQPGTFGLSPPASAFRDRAGALDTRASIADADAMAPTFRAFLVNVRHQEAPPPTVRVITPVLNEAPKLAALAAAEGASGFVLAHDLSSQGSVQQALRRCTQSATDEALAQARALASGAGVELRRGPPPGPAFALGPVASEAGVPPRSPLLPAGSPQAAAALAAPPDPVTLGAALPAAFGLGGTADGGWANTIQASVECRVQPVPPRPADLEAKRLTCLKSAASDAVAQARALLAILHAPTCPVLRLLGPRPELALAQADRVPVTATLAIPTN